jgi:hypothetical protein
MRPCGAASHEPSRDERATPSAKAGPNSELLRGAPEGLLHPHGQRTGSETGATRQGVSDRRYLPAPT